jgi:hypothetical protein
MLLRRVQKLPEAPGWFYEVKFDGYRMQALKSGDRVSLLSRNGVDYTGRLADVTQAVSRLKPGVLHLDGEIVALDETGRPSFQVLQASRRLPKGWSIGFYAFDLLRLGRRDLLRESLAQRRSLLRDVLDSSGPQLRVSGELHGNVEQIVQAVRQHSLEGVVAKRTDSLYEPGKRSGAWLKLPLKQTGTFLLGGFRQVGGLAVLLVGRFENRKFRFAGKVTQGLRGMSRLDLVAPAKLRRRGCPFSNLPSCKIDHFGEGVTAEEMHFGWSNHRGALLNRGLEPGRVTSRGHCPISQSCIKGPMPLPYPGIVMPISGAVETLSSADGKNRRADDIARREGTRLSWSASVCLNLRVGHARPTMRPLEIERSRREPMFANSKAYLTPSHVRSRHRHKP